MCITKFLVVFAVAQVAFAQSQIQFATYLGGGSNEFARAVATDSQGNIYVAGRTDSPDFPVVNPIQAQSRSYSQIYLAKFSPAGQLLFSTYFGGTDNDEATAIAVDSWGCIYITGDVHSVDFPVTNAAQGSSGGMVDAFVLKLDPAFNIVYSTYLGGRQNDIAYGIAVDPAGNAYVCGITESPDFPTSANALIAKYPRVRSGFAAKLDPTGKLVYSTLLGGSDGSTAAWSIAVDALGQAHVAGETSSLDFPVANALQPKSGRLLAVGSINSDAFISKLSADGSSLVYSTYFGGSGPDQAYGIALDSQGNAYVTGETTFGNMPIVNGPNAYLGGGVYAVSTDEGVTVQPLPNGLRTSSVNAIRFHPAQPNIVFAGTNDGVFRSDDGGNNWFASGLQSLSIGKLLIDPANPDHIYAGSGSSPALKYGTGLYGSLDGGKTWNPLNSGLAAPASATIVDSLALDPSGSGALYVNLGFGGISEGPGMPFYRVSLDGSNWTLIGQGLTTSVAASYFDQKTSTLLVATVYFSGFHAQTIAGSIYRRVGDQWVNANLSDDFRCFAAQGATIYAGARSLYSSTDGGATWSNMPFPGQGTIDQIEPHPTQQGLLYVLQGSRLWKTPDAGVTWQLLNDRSPIVSIAAAPDSGALHVGLASSADAFVAGFDLSGALIYSSYGGSLAPDRGESIAVDANGQVVTAGFRSNGSFVTGTGVFLPYDGTAYVRTYGASVSSFDLGPSTTATILGIPGRGIALDPQGNWIAAFIATANGLPVPNAFQDHLNGASDAYVIKLTP